MLQGKSGLAYVGVNALRPPDVTTIDRSPTPNDYLGYDLMHLWVVKTGTPSYELWYLADKSAGVALWLQLFPAGGGGGGGNLRSDDGNISVPDALNAINVWGGNPAVPDARLGDPTYVNIYTVQYPDINTLEVVLKRSINQPLTNATATEGMYSLGGLNFMHNYCNTVAGGAHNTWLGHASGNVVMNAGAESTGIGFNALHEIDNAICCTALGSRALETIGDGQYNVGIGYRAGAALNGADSDNIMIENPGVAGDSHTIRIGKMPFPNPLAPVGADEQNRVFISGIWNCPAIPLINTGLVLVDDSGELYVDDVPANCALVTDGGGCPRGIAGNDGEVLIGATGAAPLWKTLTAGPGIGIANGPNSITLTAGGVGAIVQLGADDGNVALPVASQVNVVGRVASLIRTEVVPNLDQNLRAYIDASVMDPAVHCEVITGMGAAADPIYKEFFCSDGSIDFDLTTDPTKVDITLVGIPPVGGVNQLTAHIGGPVPPTLNNINIEQGDNIETIGTPATSTIEIRVTDSVDLPNGHLMAKDYLEVTNGDVLIDAGNLRMPSTNGLGTTGVISWKNNPGGLNYRMIHTYGDAANLTNMFAGYRAGNTTMVDGTAVGNCGYGLACCEGLTTGAYNFFGGFDSGSKITTGSFNTGVGGRNALNKCVTGSYNCALGAYAATNYTADEHGNICIMSRGIAGDVHQLRLGTHGTGDGQQSDCYIAGIRDAAAGTSPEMVVIGTIASGYKVWSQPIPAAGAGQFQTDDGNIAVPSGAGILQVDGGYNIGTRAGANNIIIDVDASIQQDNTTAAGAGIYALGARGAGTYTTNRFMHNYGTSSTYLGYQAGPISGAGGTNCVGIGTNALDAAAGASGCVAIGRNALGAATTAKNVTAVGNSAGSAVTAPPGSFYGESIYIGNGAGNLYTTQYYNITIGNSATSSDDPTESRTARIGYKNIWTTPAPSPHDPDPVETESLPYGTQSTYLYGVYKRSVAYSGTPVYVDHLGKLGTEGGVMFAFRQTTSLPSVTGDGTVYVFGTSGGLTEDFDNTNSLVLGGAGAPAIFTAPYAGKYVFTASITMSVPASPPVPRPASVDPLYVVTSNLSYTYTNFIPASTTTVQYVSEIVTTVCYLDAGDSVRWACSAGTGATAKNISVINYLAPTIPGVGVTTCYATYFTGYRVS